MQTMEERKSDWQVIQAMKHFGGGFVKELSKLWFLADSENQQRIKEAWPEYWEGYSEMAKGRREEEGDDWWDK